MPHTFDELEKLTAEERRTLLTQLEQERGAEPFSADRWRAAVEADRARMLEELKKLSPADRQLIVDALNDLKA